MPVQTYTIIKKLWQTKKVWSPDLKVYGVEVDLRRSGSLFQVCGAWKLLFHARLEVREESCVESGHSIALPPAFTVAFIVLGERSTGSHWNWLVGMQIKLLCVASFSYSALFPVVLKRKWPRSTFDISCICSNRDCMLWLFPASPISLWQARLSKAVCQMTSCKRQMSSTASIGQTRQSFLSLLLSLLFPYFPPQRRWTTI